jgi:hypothetical protein
MRGGGEVGGQQFILLFDATRISFWLFPEGGDSSGGQVAALLDSALQSTQALQSLAYDAIQQSLELQRQTIGDLSRASSEKDKTIAAFMTAQMENAAKVAELHDQKHLRDLETQRLAASEKRKDVAVDHFVGLVDKVATIGGAAVVQKLEKKLSEGDPLDKVSELLAPEEREFFGVLLRRAMARSAGKSPEEVAAIGADVIRAPAPAAPAPAPATSSPAKAETGNAGTNGTTNGAVHPEPEPASTIRHETIRTPPPEDMKP